jgi:DNA (cytosine-5)-methyltransferase 1
MITAGDFLAGGGGVTEAMSRIPSIDVKFVLNHDQMAIRTNMYNHRGIKHYWADLYKQNEHDVEKVDFVWASIECTQHSKANGGKEKKIGSYTLGWELVRYIKFIMPYQLGIENVPEFKDWAPLDAEGKPIKERKGEEFERWKNSICGLGYNYHEFICNAADYGIPERRIRYFAFFTRIDLGMESVWPVATHNRNGTNGLKKWVACREYIDLSKEGESIFGRKYNINVRKGKRNPLSPNTLKRIAGGIKKHAPEMKFIFQYYGTGLNTQTLDVPLNTIPTKDRHVMVSLDKKQFIADHCYTDNYNLPEDPLNPILTRETKQLITVEKLQFLSDYYGRENTAHSIDGPANTITTENSKHLVTFEKQFFSKYYSGDSHFSFSPDDPFHTIKTVCSTILVDVKAQFIAVQNNSNGNPESNVISIDDPIWAMTTQEKFQFITAYYSSSGNQKSQNQDINDPLNTITGSTNKKALITALAEGLVDFDIKMRFLDPEELSMISTFPPKYFTKKELKLSRKAQTKLIGNAVPPEWAKIIIEPWVMQLENILNNKAEAV